MIGSYTQLLERRYGDRLDQDAREFMGFIVDGATRMKQLIEDLLAYRAWARAARRCGRPGSSHSLQGAGQSARRVEQSGRRDARARPRSTRTTRSSPSCCRT